jgi:hypothetical protein
MLPTASVTEVVPILTTTLRVAIVIPKIETTVPGQALTARRAVMLTAI